MELRDTPNGGGDLAVRVAWSKSTGRAVKLTLVAQPCNSTLHLELRPEEWRRLGLRTGDIAYLHARRMSVFVQDRVAAMAATEPLDRRVDQVGAASGQPRLRVPGGG